MRRWALAVVGTMMALYLLLGVALPSYVSSGDPGSVIAAEDNSATDLERGTTEKKRPSLGGTKPAATEAPKAGETKKPEPATQPESTGKRWTRKSGDKKRPSLIGPGKAVEPAPTAAPAKTPAPVVTPGPGVRPTPAPVATAKPIETPVAPTTDTKTIAELQAEIEALRARINSLTAGGVGSDEEKAKALLELVSVQEKVRREADKKQAELYFVQAQDHVAGGRYQEAYQKAKLAYSLDPDNNDYAALVRHLEGIVSSSAAVSDMQLLLDEEKAKIQQKMVEIRLQVEEARRLYSEASIKTGNDALADLNVARAKLGQAEFSLNSISAHYRSVEFGASIKELIRLVDEARDKKRFEAEQQQRDMAEKIASDIEDVQNRYLAQRIDDLIKRAYIAIHKEQYNLSELLLEKVVRLDPGNQEAVYLLRIVQKKGDEARGKNLEEVNKLETRRTWLRAEEYIIPYSTIIRYPDNWTEIDRTRSSFTEVRGEDIPEWKKLILAKMERKVTVNFIEVPLNDVITTMRELVGVTIIIDPESLDSVANPVTLSLTNMTFKTALEWILRLSGLSWTLQDEAIFIATADKIVGDKIMQIYDVRDLLGDVTYFPGPDMTLSPGEGGDLYMPDPPDPDDQLANLIEMIQTKIEPQSWDETAGASVTGREGKIIATNTEEVHKSIEQLLDSFRKAQKLQIYINARFIAVYNDFLENIGVSWSGLDRDTTPDLPGIANGAPAGFASDPTKRTGGWDAYDLRGVILNNTTANILGVSGVPYQAGEGLNLQYALLGNFQAQVILTAIQKSSNSVTLLAPRLTVFNTQRAYMMVAREEAYIADYEGLIATQAAILDPVIKTFTTGMILDVRPIISSDRKYITIELRPTQATLIQLKEYHINTYVWGLDYPVYAPVIELQKVRTTAVIPDDGVLLLGGQIVVSHWRMTSGVPFISKLPIIGRLFSHDAESKQQRQLLIFVNARIIMFEELEEQIRAQ